MEKSLLDQDRTLEQVRCENNRLKEEKEKLNKKISDYELIQEELEKFVLIVCLCLFLCLCSLMYQIKRTVFAFGRVFEETATVSI